MANREERAARCRSAVGFEVYVPQKLVPRVGAHGKRKWVKRPMFACYLFILITGEWRPAFSIQSVVGIVRNGGESAPGAVPNCAIEEIRRRESEAMAVTAKPKPQKIKVGAVVRIKGGALDDRIGVCTSVHANTVKVLLSFFGVERAIQFSRAAVEPA
jgi:transcription antitermination factor NusG